MHGLCTARRWEIGARVEGSKGRGEENAKNCHPFLTTRVVAIGFGERGAR